MKQLAFKCVNFLQFSNIALQSMFLSTTFIVTLLSFNSVTMNFKFSDIFLTLSFIKNT